VAIELLCAAQALDLFTNRRPGMGTLEAYRVIRDSIPHLETDRILADDIAAMEALMADGRILAAVEDTVGPLR
jgi:histidine ammonia-lyase